MTTSGSIKTLSQPECLWCNTPNLPALTCFDRRFGIKGKREYRFCPNCCSYSISPAPSEAELKAWYHEFYALGSRVTTAFKSGFMYRLWRHVDGQDCLYELLKPGPLLDIGCGFGDLLAIAQGMGNEVWGQEFDPISAEFSRNRGLQVREEPISSGDFPQKYFTNVVLSQVIEHVQAPVKLLKDILPLLTDHGQIIVSTPNPHGIFARLYKNGWAGWHTPFHLCMVSKKALVKAAQELGLVCIRTNTNSPGYWFFLNLYSYLYGKEGHVNYKAFEKTPYLKRRLLVLSLAPFLRTIDFLGLGDNTIIVMQKR